jgi:hypothetical protein
MRRTSSASRSTLPVSDCTRSSTRTIAGRARLSRPGRDRLVAEPDRHAATPAQPGLLGRPGRDRVGLPRDVAASVSVQLERHAGFPGSGKGTPSMSPIAATSTILLCTTLRHVALALLITSSATLMAQGPQQATTYPLFGLCSVDRSSVGSALGG